LKSCCKINTRFYEGGILETNLRTKVSV
jgi:hypothetical protein